VIRSTAVQSQPRQIVCETLSWKHPSRKRTGGVAQGVGPEFKPQYHKKKKERKKKESYWSDPLVFFHMQPWNPMHILHLQYISVQTSCMSRAPQPHVPEATTLNSMVPDPSKLLSS
jgi:hypothetical protein